VVTIGGREHVIATGDTRLFVIDPAGGRVLLDHAHGGEAHPMANESLVPVPAGEGRLFLKHRMDASTMLRLVPESDGRLRVETLWSAPVLRQSYVIPVYHDGHLYGMSGRMTLTCVDAATGALRWRSREPGDGFPLIVGGELAVLTKEGALHLGKASPEGWSERARIPLFPGSVWSPAGFADGAFFVRGQKEIVRVDWGARAVAAAPAAPVPSSKRFARFLEQLGAAPDKTAAVDAFLKELPPGPLVEWPDRVVFLYRGAANDVGIAGDMNGDRREDPMWRVPGTDLYWYEARLEPDVRVNYHFVRDFEERLPDPRNPVRVPGPGTGTLGVFPQDQSSLAMPGFVEPDYLAEAAPERRGTLTEAEVECASSPGAKVKVQVYVPAGRGAGEKLPLAIVLGGDAARTAGLVPRALDNLIPSRVEPVVVAFLGQPDWGGKAPPFERLGEVLSDLVAKDVLPFLEARFGTDTATDRRAVVGAGRAALAAAEIAFRRPSVFGAVGLQSIIMLDSDEQPLRGLAPSASDAPLRVYLDWSRYDRRATRERWDMGAANARFAAFLRERGYRPAGGEAPEGSGWAGWRNRTDRLFGTLFPPRGPDAPAARNASR
jgi:enterochelin esterase-like enzyme